MARPGLEPGTPRFSVVVPERSSSADLQVISPDHGVSNASGLSRICALIRGVTADDAGPSAFSSIGVITVRRGAVLPSSSEDRIDWTRPAPSLLVDGSCGVQDQVRGDLRSRGHEGVVLLEDMPGRADGVELARELKSCGSGPGMLLLAERPDASQVATAKLADADGSWTARHGRASCRCVANRRGRRTGVSGARPERARRSRAGPSWG
jgi:hypothetical protein